MIPILTNSFQMGWFNHQQGWKLSNHPIGLLGKPSTQNLHDFVKTRRWRTSRSPQGPSLCSFNLHSSKLTWLAGKSPSSIGNTSSNGPFSIAMLVYQRASFANLLQVMTYESKSQISSLVFHPVGLDKETSNKCLEHTPQNTLRIQHVKESSFINSWLFGCVVCWSLF